MTDTTKTSKYKNRTCRGSYQLGSACGHCERCTEEKATMGKPVASDIIQLPVQTFIERKLCQKCDDGQLEATADFIVSSDPPQLLHKCNGCGSERYFRDKWPRIVYKEKL